MNLIDIALNGFKPMPVELRAFTTSLKNARNQMDVVPGATFQNLEIVTNITNPLLITKVEVELNGENIVNCTGSDLKMVQACTKRTRSAARYLIPFYRSEAKTIDGMRSGELVTLPTDTFTVFVTVGETAALVPTLRGRALVTPSQSVRYFIPKLDVINVNASADGRNDYFWNNRSAALFIRRLHFGATDITKMRIYRDDLKVFEANAEDNAEDLGEGDDNAPQANYFHFDPAHIGFQLQGLFPTIARKELRFEFEKTAGGNVRVVRETIQQVTMVAAKAA
jgi:hypothetical protein